PAIRRVVATGLSAADPEDLLAAQAAIEAVASTAAAVDSIGIIDRDGTFVVSSTADSLGNRGPQRDYFQAPMQGSPFVSGVTISNVTGAPTIFHAVPIRGPGGQIDGVLRSRSTLEVVQQAVAAARDRIGPDSNGLLVDANGIVLATTIDPTWQLHP